jgi:IS4 transposase
VELFFKWIKQHLKIKAFYGASLNAVQTQIWVAISVYLLMAIAKKELRIERSLSEIQQILDRTIFQKEPILQALSQRPIPNLEDTVRKGPSLFDI